MKMNTQNNGSLCAMGTIGSEQFFEVELRLESSLTTSNFVLLIRYCYIYLPIVHTLLHSVVEFGIICSSIFSSN